jgi:phosphoglycolate phosphatase
MSSAERVMKRLIVYDLDGTLVDTAEDITRAVNYMLEHFNHPPLPRKAVLQYVGYGLHHLIKECLKINDPVAIERGIDRYAEYYTDHLLDYSRLYPLAQDVLDYFKDRTQAVITNKPNPYSLNILTGLGVADYFREIIAGEDGYPSKPNPTGLQAIMERAGATPQQTLLIGDSPVDVETGRNAGVLTVVMTHGFVGEQELAAAQPDIMVRHFEELMAIARQRGW